MTWRCCVNDPPELGKKVLVCTKGNDIVVAMRFDDFYIPFPFVSHKFAKHVSKPELWCEINFPKGLHGYHKVSINGDLTVQLTMDQYKKIDPKSYQHFADCIINALGTE